jgi:ABC-type glycerol-3-phosphate transport system permease component
LRARQSRKAVSIASYALGRHCFRANDALYVYFLTGLMLPLVRPALVIVAIYNIIPIWNDFFFPLVFIKASHLRTLPLGMTAGAIKG